MTRKRIVLLGINGALLLALGAGAWGMHQEISQSQAKLSQVQADLQTREDENQALSHELAEAKSRYESLELDKYELEFKEKMAQQKVVVGKVFANGYLKKHGNHYHFVYGKPPVNAIFEEDAQAIRGTSGSDDHYVFNPADVVEENAEGYVVRHGDHFHFIYKRDVAAGRTSQASQHHVEEEPFVFNRSNIISEDANGYVVRHGDHTHYVYKRDLANAPVVPNPASSSPAAQPGGCRLVRIPHGDHFHDFLDCGQGTPQPSFQDSPSSQPPIATPQPAQPGRDQDGLASTVGEASSSPETPASQAEWTLQSPEIQPYLNYISYAYGVERETIKLQAVNDAAGHYRGQVFAFQNMEQGQDKSHIHPWVVPLWTLDLPSRDQAVDPELRFARELASLAKRMGIKQDDIRILGDRFEIPHGDHSHTIRIVNVEGVQSYQANQLAALQTLHVPGELDEATVKRYIESLRKLAQERYTGQELDLMRIENGLLAIEETLSNRGNSTQGFLKLLDRFATRYIFRTSEQGPSISEAVAKMNDQHASIIQAISQLNLEDYGITADQLRDQANQAIEAQDAEALASLEAYVVALKDCNDRPGVEAMKYLYFLTQHVQDKPLGYDVREQVSSVIAQLSTSSAVFGGEDPIEPIFSAAIKAKQAIQRAHTQFTGEIDTRVGEAYKKITTATSPDSPSILSDSKSFAAEVLDEADKDQTLPVTNFEEEDTSASISEEASEPSQSEEEDSETAESSSREDEDEAEEASVTERRSND